MSRLLKFRLLVLVMLAGVMLSGCSSYQYMKVASRLPKDTRGNVMLENDTVQVAYQFEEYNQVHVRITNKLPVPLYVNWQESGVIVKGENRPFYSNKSMIQANTTGTATNMAGVYQNTYQISSSHTSGVLVGTEALGFVPPTAAVQSANVLMVNDFVDLKGVKMNMRQLNTASTTYVKFIQYNESTSPLPFRVYLTLSTDRDFQKPMRLDKAFWVEEIVKTSLGPGSVPGIKDRSDHFFVQKATAGGGVLLGLVTLGLIVAALAVQ